MINKLAGTLLSFSVLVGVGYPALAQTDSTIVDDETTNDGINQTVPSSQGVDTPDGSTDMGEMEGTDSTIVDDETTNDGINQTVPSSQGVDTPDGSTDMGEMEGTDSTVVDDQTTFDGVNQTTPASQGVSPDVNEDASSTDMDMDSMDDDDSDFSTTQESEPVRGLW